ncbi:hypothetical protein EDEG_00388 [Edhazardia aedis USNM 41457]|uniref:SAC domain-containing protein n=1 Tax=Edhazardia aedis (strain USNM 41457) TaxID=1003232 RepID=J9DK35_EDHAE|nr:hypothetical protein EDEG_00388 [Edhazardia aedis USNM 41457]|eukprot:EJW01722.1 hypothetical protein EDEG_00388 [Edhazardia aedis USNM 41457]
MNNTDYKTEEIPEDIKSSQKFECDYEKQNIDTITKNEDKEKKSLFFIPYLFTGYFKTVNIRQNKFTILSMICSKKIGPRFMCRGINDNGDVSFFVETYVELYNIPLDKTIIRMTLLRGSIPLF